MIEIFSAEWAVDSIRTEIGLNNIIDSLFY